MHYLRVGEIQLVGGFFVAAILDESDEPASLAEMEQILDCVKLEMKIRSTDAFLPGGSDKLYLSAVFFRTADFVAEALEEVIRMEGLGMGKLIQVDFRRRAG